MMKRSIICLVLLLFVGTAIAGTTHAHATPKRSSETARRALSPDSAVASKAIAELRAMGPTGLEAFLEANRAEVNAAVGSRNPASQRILGSLDSICAQKDCYASRLYWYTDLHQAELASKTTGKPILSLRLLGRLDADLSCANSRFFRITLYANEQVSRFLGEHFVLQWQSVRPVPKITIDFGDGRKMERTLTGNSIHYILTPDGRVIDALPGLYGPLAFLRELQRSLTVASTLQAATSVEQVNKTLRDYHQTRLSDIEAGWDADTKRAGLARPPSREVTVNPDSSKPPSAPLAGTAAVTKALRLERPVLRGLFDNTTLLDTLGNDAGWSAIARLHGEDAKLDEATRSLMLVKDPSLKGIAIDQSLTALERSIAEDTVRNEYILHARIHQWLAGPMSASSVDTLNERVYAELFLTPGSDAWLGLRPSDSFSGIDNDGIRP
jgi:hypothetical protein